MKKIFLIVLLALTLSACTDQSNVKYKTGVKGEKMTIEENFLEEEPTTYKKSNINLINDENYAHFASKSGDCLYLYATDKIGNNLFFKYDLDKKTCTQLNLKINGKIHSMDAVNSCIYILVTESDHNENDCYELKKYNCETDEQSSMILNHALCEMGTVGLTDFFVVEDCIYLSAGDRIFCLDNAGNIVATIKLENICKGFFPTGNKDSIIMYTYRDGGGVAQELTQILQPIYEYRFETEYTRVFPGLSNDYVFVMDESKIYSLNLKTGDKKIFVSTLLYNLRSANFIPLSENSFFTIQTGVPTIWSASTREEAEQITTLKCATYNAPFELKLAVSMFNYNHENIKIDVEDYAVYNDGLTNLFVEMTAGKIPDIIDLSAVQLPSLNSEGVLQNLEESLCEKNIVPSILETLSNDEGIYEFVPGFKIVAMAGSSDYFPAPCVNTDDLLNTAEKAHEEGSYLFPQYISRETFVSFILSFSSNKFVDIDKAYCDFENESFARLMQFAVELPSNDELDEETYIDAIEGEYSAILDGKQLVSLIESGNPAFELIRLKTLYGDTMKFLGFPSESGAGVAMTPFLRLGISSVSLHKDKVGVFFDYLLSQEFQREISKTSYMPVVCEYLDEYISNYVDRYSVEPLKLSIPDSMQILECPRTDNETITAVWDLIDRVDRMNEYDINIYKIVLSESQAFFSGQKTISEVQSLIQSRVALYVYEKQ